MKIVTVTHSCDKCRGFIRSTQTELNVAHSTATVVAGPPEYCSNCTTVQLPEINVWQCVPALASDVSLDIDGQGGYELSYRVCEHDKENNCE